MSLARLFPSPWPVAIGGRTFYVGELRVRDLAAIQGWIEARAGDPLADAHAADALTDPEARLAGLRAAWKVARDWPPLFGSEAARPLVETPAYRAWFAWLAISRSEPSFTPAMAVELSAGMSVAEHLALSRACWRPDPARTIARLIDPEGSDRRGAPVDWEELVAELVAACPWELTRVGDLPVSALMAVLRGGKPPRATVACNLEGEAFAEFMARRRKLFYGDDGASGP